MLITLIGAGNLATQLGLALKEKGHKFLQVYSKTTLSAENLADKLDALAVTIPGNIKEADLYICALKDDAIQEVLSCINFEKGILVHTAGSLPMNILSNYSSTYGVIYPLQTFSKNRKANFNEIPLFIEANNPECMEIIKNVSSGLSGNVRILESEIRIQLHLAAVFACNFVNHLYAVSGELLNEQGLGFELLLPLIDETAKKVHEISPALAQTGPAKRFDKNIIEKHLSLLESHPEWMELYEKLSRDIYNKNKQHNIS